MVQAWDINDALMGGTLYMRQLGEAYLPRWPKEDKEDYKSARLWPRFFLPTKRPSTRTLAAYSLSRSTGRERPGCAARICEERGS